MKKIKPLQNLNENDFEHMLKNMSEASRRLKKEGKDVKDLIKTEGVSVLTNSVKRAPGSANKFSHEIEKIIIDYSLLHPTYGQRKVAKDLNEIHKWKISEGGVRRVWMRNKLELIELRVKHLMALAAKGLKLTDEQMKALEPKKIIFTPKIQDPVAERPGELFVQEVFYMGEVPELGKIYQQLGMDVASGVVVAKAYTVKTAITAAEYLNSKVLPFFAEHAISIETLQTNQGLSYCGNESHPFELFLTLNEISHKVEKSVAPQLYKAKDEFIKDFYDVAAHGHYTSLEALNKDLEEYQEYYNKTRKILNGKSAYTTFTEAIRHFAGKGETVLPRQGSKTQSKVIQ